MHVLPTYFSVCNPSAAMLVHRSRVSCACCWLGQNDDVPSLRQV